MNIKHLISLLIVLALSGFAWQCGGEKPAAKNNETQVSTTEESTEITEENALEEADKLIQELDNM